MLDTLRRIVQEVNAAKDLAEASATIVSSVLKVLCADMCSVYQRLPDTDTLTLMATQGLSQDTVGKITLDIRKTLIGLVAERGEPVNLEDASTHPRYAYYPETGEERFHGFVGVPILYQRQILGVLVVQQTAARSFDEDQVAFLVTLAAQLAGALSQVRTVVKLADDRAGPRRDVLLKGIAAAPGVVVGRVVVIFPETDLGSVPDRAVDDVAAEEKRFRDAVDEVRKDIKKLKENMGPRLRAEDVMLFDAYIMMLGSASLMDATVNRIREGSWAAGALRRTIADHAKVFAAMTDVYMRERADDLYDLGQRILNYLLRGSRTRADFHSNTILVGRNITASQLAEVPADRLKGVISASGSSSSHVAIIARALDVPTVMGVQQLPVSKLDGKEVVVNGYDGSIYIQPSVSVRAEFLRLARQERELSKGLKSQAVEPAITKDGHRVSVQINSGMMPEMLGGQTDLADGVGLYRTELPFMVRDRFPGEQEQAALYSGILNAFPGKPVVLRTLDVGGDKSLNYFPIKEDNPFLGFRGIRISLDHPEIFMTQLRAMLIANERHGNLKILFPMVGCLQQVDEALMLLEHARLELIESGHVVPRVSVGVMVEVPAAVYIAKDLAERVDFLSIGSNDLIQYLLAVDRNNETVARLYDEMHPAVLRALHDVVEAGHAAGKPVSICGELASDPGAVLLLLGMGLDSLSVNMSGLPRVKWVIRSFSLARAKELFVAAMALSDSAAIRCMLDRELVDAGLGALVRAGR